MIKRRKPKYPKARKLRRRARKSRPLSLTRWRALILFQTMRDLARHGRLNALAAFVLGAESEVRDMETFAILAALGAGAAERGVRFRLQRDPLFSTWREAKALRDQ